MKLKQQKPHGSLLLSPTSFGLPGLSTLERNGTWTDVDVESQMKLLCKTSQADMPLLPPCKANGVTTVNYNFSIGEGVLE